MTVPVVLLTGFLGSGKTTLLNRILAAGPVAGGKLAVIVNEFGDVGIDSDLLPEDMSKQVELPGGCICCMLDEDLGKTIAELLEPADANISLIVIETTGIAEPVPISWSLGSEPLCDLVRLAAIVTTVDACEHERHRPLSPSVDAQVDDADILVITKADLTGAADIETLTGQLRERNPHAPILATSGDEAAIRLRELLADPGQAESLAVGKGEEPDEHRHNHDHIQSRALPIRHTLDFEELTEQLQELPPNYLRIKGIADVIDPGAGWDEPTRVAFHRVGARVSVEQLPPSRGGEPRLVAVGYELDDDRLADCLQHAVISS